MRALLVTHGTRGDVQPMLALAVALRTHGHEAVLAGPDSFADAAEEYDVEFASLSEGPNQLMDDPVIKEAIEGGYRGMRGKITAVRTAQRVKPLMAEVLHNVGVAARSPARTSSCTRLAYLLITLPSCSACPRSSSPCNPAGYPRVSSLVR
ncbi:glycosyltransferase [Amycolatopsis azurea]|uniref:glycosyltransferase n=1 Tax=Amycolatopsis azurea TaxID=36819 RepID=UPI00382E11F6